MYNNIQHRLASQFYKSIIAKRYISLSKVAKQSWNPVIYSRNLDLGRSLFKSYAVSAIIDYYPHLTPDQVDDTVQGLAYNNILHSILPEDENLQSIESSSDLLAKLGSLKLRDDTESLNDILNLIQEHCLKNISNELVTKCMKLQRPKKLLQIISEEQNTEILMKNTKLSDDLFEAQLSVNYDDRPKLYIERGLSKHEAERLACVACLEDEQFSERFNAIDISGIDFPFEEDIHLDADDHRRRNIVLEKEEGEPFGFTIRGGELKSIKNKDYMQLNYITPIFISSIAQDSPAEKAGFRKGDVLLAVEDYALKDLTHKQAVISLKKFLKHKTVDFIVSYEKMELMKYEAEQDMVERHKDKIRAEIKSKNLGKWHQIKAKQNPDEYFTEQLVEKRRPFQPKQGRKAVRPWEIRLRK